ncbi:restriction endonuclease subunit S [Thermodesulfobacteriota bacterium]
MSEKTFDGIEGVQVLTMGDIQSGKVLLGGQKLVPFGVEGLPALYLKNGDLLYNRTNSAELVGKTGIYNGPDNAYTFASYLVRIRCLVHCVHPAFLNLAMNAPLFRVTQIEPHLKQQCGQANVNATIMKNMIVPIPPLDEQHRIVAKVDELIAHCDDLIACLGSAQTTQVQLADAIVNQVA